MAVLFTFFFMLFLNIPALILIITGVVFVKDEKPVGKLSLERTHNLGNILIILGVIWTVYGLFTGYGIQ